MFRRAKTFVQNHWKKAVVGGIAVQVAAYGLKYATNKFITFQEDQARLYWKKIKKQQNFESLDENCILTFRQMVQLMKLTIVTTLDVEAVLERLKTNQVTNKLVAWEELKVLAFSRVLCNIYGPCILYVLIRVQLSVIGGSLFKETSDGRRQATANVDGALLSSETRIDGDLQRKYMSLANHFATEGTAKLCAYIQRKVKCIVSQMSLKQDLSASDLEQTFWAIIRKDLQPADFGNDEKFESLPNPITFPWEYILPNDIQQNHEFFMNSQASVAGNPDLYRRLVCETYDLLRSDDVIDILRFFESHGVSHFVDRLSDIIDENAVRTTTTSTEEQVASGEEQAVFTEPRVVLAKLIPVMNSLHCIDVIDDPWMHLLTNSESVRALSANIYEAFSYDPTAV